jgi:phosphate-selective porin OprO/OprP
MTSVKPGIAIFGLLLAPMAVSAAPQPPDFEIGGQVQIDSSFFNGAHNGHLKGSQSGVRRARLGLKHESKKGWEGEFEIDVDDEANEVSITDAFVSYTGFSVGNITFGKMKEPFGLENSTGSKSINTIERSIVTEAFKPGRNQGLLFSRTRDSYSFYTGVFQAAEDEQGLDSYAVTGRLALHPVNTETRLIHLGVSFSERDMGETRYRVNESLEVDAAESIIEGRRIDTDSLTQFSVEAAAVFGPFSIQGEWMEQEITPIAVDGVRPESTTYSGHYVLASYFLTGESRPYKKGSFSGVKPNSESGAWEIVVRSSTIDLDDYDNTVKADTITLGVNYYATGRVRLMLHAAKSDVESPIFEESGKGESLTFRAQYAF